jgi:putative ABC transport system ATP-binding protein
VTPSFTFDAVSVTRGSATLLRDVDVHVPGEGITAVVGPSGSGKSTLLRCCNRLEVPSHGTVRFGGKDIAALGPLALRRQVAMVFQAPVVFPGTVLDNLRAGAPHLTERDAGSLLDLVGIDGDYLRRAADTLSGGEAQRVVVARALATQPVALLGDEPTSALDDRSTQRLEELAVDLASTGMVIVWVTHDLQQARRIASHLVVVERGTVTWSGPIADPGAERALDALMRDDEGETREATDGR